MDGNGRRPPDLALEQAPGGPLLEPQVAIEGVGTSAGPALEYFDGTAWLAWRGIDDDHRIRVATRRGDFRDEVVVPGIGTSTSPALLAHHDRLYLFWRGIDNANIYTTSRPRGTGDWQPRRPVQFAYPLAGEVGGLDIHDALSANGPTAVRWNDVILLAWRGHDDDQRLYTTTSSDGGQSWQGQVMLTDRGSAQSPDVIAWDGRLLMAWRGVTQSDDTRLFYSTLG